ncbi:MAG: 50S ribosomal protein L3 N(5)-glutamine methyltransferase [Beijerinckiaceae bacterium]|jgi:ribosomal protein L3 glutamine methyltransferase|nr:50S ribosomal protein L3 N(5)-glutamine methyltransferase [Beijerinckiaceae bacterium]
MTRPAIPDPAKVAAELVTPRDFMRHAISQFRVHDLVFGHGTTDALDEAVFIILEALNLPIDKLDPFLDARLLPEERRRLADLVNARVTTRKPASYLLNRAYVGGVPFFVDERVIVPRSFIGELLRTGLFSVEEGPILIEPEDVTMALDLCTGSGCLAILAAQAFPNAHVDAVDLSEDALEVAKINVAESGLTERLNLFHGDLFAPLSGKRYDVIITNPPYVDADVMEALPDEYRHEPQMALAGGPDGLDVVRRILAEAGKHLTDGGGLLCEMGEGRDIIEAEYPDLPFLWLDTHESAGEVFWLEAAALRS